MQTEGDEVHFETDEARGASTPNIVRWVLAVSLFAAIALLSVVWITGAATQGPVESEATADGRERLLQEYGARGGVRASSEGDGEGLLGDDADEIEAAPDAGYSERAGPPVVENEPEE